MKKEVTLSVVFLFMALTTGCSASAESSAPTMDAAEACLAYAAQYCRNTLACWEGKSEADTLTDPDECWANALKVLNCANISAERTVSKDSATRCLEIDMPSADNCVVYRKYPPVSEACKTFTYEMTMAAWG